VAGYGANRPYACVDSYSIVSDSQGPAFIASV
jgi:hypothetical protein